MVREYQGAYGGSRLLKVVARILPRAHCRFAYSVLCYHPHLLLDVVAAAAQCAGAQLLVGRRADQRPKSKQWDRRRVRLVSHARQ